MGVAFARSGDHRRRIYKLYAFLGRYGHFSLDALCNRPVHELQMLAEEVGELIKQEKDSITTHMETNGP